MAKDMVKTIMKKFNEAYPGRVIFSIRDGNDVLYKGRKAWTVSALDPDDEFHFGCGYVMFKDNYEVEPYFPAGLSKQGELFNKEINKDSNRLYFDQKWYDEFDNSFDRIMEDLWNEKDQEKNSK